ncbi:Glucose-1-phosphate adenylyltransferase [compost metagenome]
MLGSNHPLHAYEFQGYWRDVGTVHSLWEAHMDLLSGDHGWQFMNEKWPMYTNGKFSEYDPLRSDHAQTRNNMVHERCDMQGYAERSVIFGGTEVGRYTKIKDSVIMPNVTIGRNVQIERAIIGEGAVIKDGAVIKGNGHEIFVVGPDETIASKPAMLPQPSRLLKEVYDTANRLLAEGLSS